VTATVTMDPRIRARRDAVRAELGRRRIRRFVGFATVVALVAAAGLATRSPLLDVDEVGITGATATSEADVISASGVAPGQALIDVDLASARRSIAALPWVDEVRSTRSWNGAISFEVTEREPVAQAIVDGHVVLVDIEGRVLEVPGVADDDLVVVTGVSGSAEPGGWLASTALDALGVAAAVDADLVDRIGAIEVQADGSLDVQLDESGRVRLGGAIELDAKLLALQTMLERVDLQCLDILDLQVPTVPVLTRQGSCS